MYSLQPCAYRNNSIKTLTQHFCKRGRESFRFRYYLGCGCAKGAQELFTSYFIQARLTQVKNIRRGNFLLSSNVYTALTAQHSLLLCPYSLLCPYCSYFSLLGLGLVHRQTSTSEKGLTGQNVHNKHG